MDMHIVVYQAINIIFVFQCHSNEDNGIPFLYFRIHLYLKEEGGV